MAALAWSRLDHGGVFISKQTGKAVLSILKHGALLLKLVVFLVCLAEKNKPKGLIWRRLKPWVKLKNDEYIPLIFTKFSTLF